MLTGPGGVRLGMREFIVVAHEAPTEPDFPLDDLAGGAGRLDVLCRCVAAALLSSHGIRRDARIALVIRDTLTVRLDGSTVRSLAPDERAVAGLIRRALEATERAVGAQAVEVSPGVTVNRLGLAAALADAPGPVVHLDETGEPVTVLDPVESVTFVLADHRSFTDDEVALLADRADRRLRLGPTRLHADQAITVAHHFLDTGGYSSF